MEKKLSRHIAQERSAEILNEAARHLEELGEALRRARKASRRAARSARTLRPCSWHGVTRSRITKQEGEVGGT